MADRLPHPRRYMAPGVAADVAPDDLVLVDRQYLDWLEQLVALGVTARRRGEFACIAEIELGRALPFVRVPHPRTSLVDILHKPHRQQLAQRVAVGARRDERVDDRLDPLGRMMFRHLVRIGELSDFVDEDPVLSVSATA